MADRNSNLGGNTGGRSPSDQQDEDLNRGTGGLGASRGGDAGRTGGIGSPERDESDISGDELGGSRDRSQIGSPTESEREGQSEIERERESGIGDSEPSSIPERDNGGSNR